MLDAVRASLDVDGNGVAGVATDVVYIARQMFGLPAVPPSFRVLDPSIPPDSVIAANLAGLCSAGNTGVCGNGRGDPGEDCDVGGTCIGGTNAGTACTSESQCQGDGVCLAGQKVLSACSTDSDCSGSTCVHCKTFGGASIPGDSVHTCSANCTFETAVPCKLVPGVASGTDITSGSGAVVHGEVLTIPLPFTGSETLSVGKEKDGQMPVVIEADSVHLPAIPVSNIACACLRELPAKTCGGTIFEKKGSQSLDCSDTFSAGDSVRAGKVISSSRIS
jgi:hypothetical protein